MSLQLRSGREVPGVFIDRIPGGDQEKVLLRAVVGDVGVGFEEEEKWRLVNRVGVRGNSNAVGTIDGSKVAYNHPYGQCIVRFVFFIHKVDFVCYFSLSLLSILWV